MNANAPRVQRGEATLGVSRWVLHFQLRHQALERRSSRCERVRTREAALGEEPSRAALVVARACGSGHRVADADGLGVPTRWIRTGAATTRLRAPSHAVRLVCRQPE
jgi:hypothetical protein